MLSVYKTSFSHCITKDDVIRAVKHLNPWKSGGASGVMSDSVIHGTHMLFEYITCLFNTSARPEVRGTADVGWRSLNPLPINPPRTHSRLYHHKCLRTDGR